MTDIATLGLAIRSDGVVVAKDRLKDLEDQSRRTEGTTTSSLGKITNSVLQLVAAYATWKTAEAVVTKFISASVEAERVQTRLETVVLSTGKAAGWSADQLSGLADELSKTTTFSSNAIKEAEAIMLGYGRVVGKVFPEAMKATLDFSEALGVSLTQAAETVGKALDLPSRGMTSLADRGFFFTKQQIELAKEMERTGRIAEAQQFVLDELAFAYGGAAEAARGTLGGALKALQNAFDDLFVVTDNRDLTKGVNSLVDVLEDPATKTAIQNFGGWLFDAIAWALEKLVEFYNLIQLVIALGKVMTGNAKIGLRGTNPEETAAAENVLRDQLTNGSPPTDLSNWIDVGDDGNFLVDDPRKKVLTDDFGTDDVANRRAASQQKAYERLIETAQKRIDQLSVEAEMLGMSGVQAMEYSNYQTLLNQAIATGVEIDETRLAQLEALAEKQTDLQLTIEGLNIAMENRTPWEVFQEELEKTIELFDRGKISAGDFMTEIGKAAQSMVRSYASAANDVIGNVEKLTDALGLQGREAFEVQKALSIAKAVVAGGEAVINSFNVGTAIGGPPVGFAFAALAGAAAVAQVAAIASTSYNSTTVPNAMGGSSTAGDPTAAASNNKSMNVTLVGDAFNRETVERLAGLFSELAGDGVDIRTRSGD